MEVVVTGRHIELSDRYRAHVEEKLGRLEKHDHRIIRVQVEVEHERNPRQHDRAVRLELTAFSKGPVIRAEACAADKMAALDMALDTMASQMPRAADRRRARSERLPVRMNQGAPKLVAVESFAGVGTGAARSGNRLYVTEGRGVRVYDLAAAEAPTLLGVVELAGSAP